MRTTFFYIIITVIYCFSAYAQQDSLKFKNPGILKPVDPKTVSPFSSDSTFNYNHIKLIQDSIAMIYLMPDSLRRSTAMDGILKTDLYKVLLQPGPNSKIRNKGFAGLERDSRAPWVIVVIILLLIYTCLLNIFLGADVKTVLQSFYSKQIMWQADKDGGLINSWAFTGLFLLFSLSLGMLLYQFTLYYNIMYNIKGFQFFVLISILIGLLLILKFVILKFLGFIFNISNVINQYITVLNLTYFNLAFVFLFAAISISTIRTHFIPALQVFILLLIGIIFLWQYLRNSLKIISDFRFQKFYLFIYLCALEFCPVIILIKALYI